MTASHLTLKDVCEAIVDCEHKTAPTQTTGHPSIRTPNIGRGRLILDGVNRVSDETYKLWTQRMEPQPGDLILAREAPVGNVAIVPRGLRVCLGQRTVLIRADRRKVLPEYLVYLMLGDEIQARVQSLSNGATVHHLNMKDIRGLALPKLPEPDEQRRIASILSAYDDLIENNTRRIAILEEMVRRIYEEWFVRFRFPGHENARMVESELGPMPEGWEKLPLGALLSYHIGGGWGKDELLDEHSVPAFVIRGTDIPDVRGGGLGRAPLRYHTPSNFRSRELQGGDIVFEVSGGSKDQPVGRSVLVGQALLAKATHPIICASFCRLIRADKTKILPDLLQFHFERIYANREIMQYQTQSTGITNFKFTVFLEKEFVIRPSSEAQESFATAVKPMIAVAETLGFKNQNLRKTRDLLLPKLISGELAVSSVPEPEAAVA